MKTILTLADDCRNCKTLNLSIVGFGENEKVYQLLVKTKLQLSALLGVQPIAFYNSKTLGKAEGDPRLLHNKVALDSLRISKKDFTREYVGFVDQYVDAELYDYLFSSGRDYAMLWKKTPAAAPYYSINNLSTIIHEKFGKLDYDGEATFADVIVGIMHEVLPSGKSFARVDCKIAEYLCENSIEVYINKFRDVVKTLDLLCPDALHSAYISLNYPSMAIARQRVYRRYDPEMLERYILGAEWYVYLNKRVPLGPDLLSKASMCCVVEKVYNGIAVTANTNIKSFCGTTRRKISLALENILIPAFGEYSWSGLNNQLWSVCDLPKRIDVFCDKPSMRDPIVVFSHNYDFTHLCEMNNSSPKDLIASWVLK